MSYYREEPTQQPAPRSRLQMDDIKVLGALFLLLVGLLAAVVGGLWLLTGELEPDILRAWAIVATLLLPLVGWACYKWGHTEARGRLKGMDDGVGKVVQAAGAAIDLRAKHAVTIKQVMNDPDPYVVLPPIEASYRLRPQLTEGDRVELE